MSDDGFLRAFAACEAAIRRWIGRFAPPDPPPQLPVARVEPALSNVAAPPQRGPRRPPPPVSELPVLRFAATNDPKERGDIYDGDVYEGESVVHTAWLWTKRLVLTAVLLAGGIMAALTWEAWLPQAAQGGRNLATKVDRYVRSRNQAERRRQAVQETSAQLPHLAPETIQAVLSLDQETILEPPQVFHLAYDAAERGLSALAPGEAHDLKALRSTLLATLGPAERERVREYDRARAQRITLPFEDRDVLELFARGAGALPSQSRERLQELSGKAVAAGLRMGVSPKVP